MSNLDKSLDEIAASQRSARGRGRTRRGRAAPAGGIKKVVARSVTKPVTKSAAKAEAVKSATPGAVKIIVSNLPHDVNESQIKEYFSKSAGPIKTVSLAYGPNGNSKGIATIIFRKPSAGAKALEANGTKVDNKPMKIEAVYDALHIPNTEAKSLLDRVSAEKPKVEPKKVKAAKPTEVATRGGRGRGRGRAARGGRSRPKSKTADELDAEMTDYFNTTGAGDAVAPAANGTATAATAGGDDTGMDEIS